MGIVDSAVLPHLLVPQAEVLRQPQQAVQVTKIGGNGVGLDPASWVARKKIKRRDLGKRYKSDR